LEESLVYQDLRPFQCATPFCKIPDFFPCYCLSIKTRRRRPRPQVVPAKGDFIAQTIPANPGVAFHNSEPVSIIGSAFVAAFAAGERLRHRYAFSGDACTWRCWWSCVRAGMPARTQARPSWSAWRFRRVLWSAGGCGGARRSPSHRCGWVRAPPSCPRWTLRSCRRVWWNAFWALMQPHA